MDSKELQELLKLVNRLELAEFKYKQGDLQFSVRTKFYMNAHPGMEGMTQYVQMPSPPVISASPVASSTPDATSKAISDADGDSTVSAPTAAAKDNLIEIRSPIVGTFYRSASPDKPVYVNAEDTIEVGTVICILEGRKLFNDIEVSFALKSDTE